MMKRSLTIFTEETLAMLVALVALSHPIDGVAQHFPASDALRALVQSRVTDIGMGGIVLGVMEADGSTLIISDGDAGPDARPLGPESVFEIGSLTKAFTATLLADMVVGGDVSLSDPVARYLPERVTMPRREGREVTLLDLATHHSALPRVPGNLVRRDRRNPFADYSVERLYEFLSGYELRRDIGSRFEYSNLGFGLLGHTLALVADAEYEDLLRERVLAPLGMRATGIGLVGDRLAWSTRGHDDDGQVTPSWEMPALEGAGALRSSVQELLLFLAEIVGPPASRLGTALELAHQVHVRVDERRALGLAWRIERAGDVTVVLHTGGTAGFQSFLGFVPETGVGVVVLVNSNRTSEPHAAGTIGRLLLDPRARGGN